MKTNVTICNAGVKTISEGHWNIFSGQILLSIGFDIKQGLILEQFDNLTGSRPVHYAPDGISLLPLEYKDEKLWALESVEIAEAGYGGRPTVRLDLVISTFEIRLYFHAIAFPLTSIIREWWEIENTAVSDKRCFTIRPFQMNFTPDDYRDTYHCTYFKGGKPRYDHGQICQEAIGSETSIHLYSNMHYDYVPMLIVHREQEPCDGFMVAMDYCGPWDLDIKRNNGPVSLKYSIDENKYLTVLSGEKFNLPVVTLGGFTGSIDELMKTVYDWQ